MRLSDFDHWAQRHHGLLTQRASGLDADTWRRAIRTGTLIEVHRHVARLPGSPPTPVQDVHAAVLAGGDGAVASHRSAAMLWGLLDVEPHVDLGGGIHITMSNRARNPRIAGVYVHRPTDLHRLAPVQRHRIACTDPIRTLCDLGADDPELVPAAVDAALSSHLVRLEELRSAVIEHRQRGRGGIPALRSALASRTAPSLKPTASPKPTAPPKPATPLKPTASLAHTVSTAPAVPATARHAELSQATARTQVRR